MFLVRKEGSERKCGLTVVSRQEDESADGDVLSVSVTEENRPLSSKSDQPSHQPGNILKLLTEEKMIPHCL